MNSYLSADELDAIQSLPRDTPYLIDGISHGITWSRDSATVCGVPYVRADLAQVQPTLSVAQSIAAEQADDPSLWFVATTATEAHLQHALRHLAAAVEGTLVSTP